MNQEPTPREMGHYMSLAMIGIEMVMPTIFGYWLDVRFATTPWITIVAAVLGFAAGMIHLLAILKQKERDESSDKKPPP